MPQTNLNLSKFPQKPGVYIMRDNAASIIYIGKAIRLRTRVSSYFNRPAPSLKIAALLRVVRHIDYILSASESEALVIERDLIFRYQPYYNTVWKDGKSYPYIKLTNEDFPRLIITRSKTDDGAKYFGPYPDVRHMKSTLHWLRGMFGLRRCSHVFDTTNLPPEKKVKSCLYLHAGKCPGPCLGNISSKDYKQRLKGAGLLLSGKYAALKELLSTEMKLASAKLDFERAAALRDRLQALASMNQLITVRELSAADFTASLETTGLLEKVKDVLRLPTLPAVIEGFDISNIAGTACVGSMVRFFNAKPDKSNYRKFKIRTVAGQNDFAMIKETVLRRYSRLLKENLPLPDLVLIDGGKGQLKSASEALESLKVKTPVISLAKQNEEIFFPGKEESLKLPEESPVLHLLQSVRDESHRFALSYNLVRRRINFGIPSPRLSHKGRGKLENK
jgi:excinuclease ABC subunit C